MPDLTIDAISDCSKAAALISTLMEEAVLHASEGNMKEAYDNMLHAADLVLKLDTRLYEILEQKKGIVM